MNVLTDTGPGLVVVLGAHSTSGRSMHRHAALLCEAWSQLAVETASVVPAGPLSRRLRRAGYGAQKWAGYVEKFLLFLPRLRREARRADLLHIADHSDAIWVLLVPRRTRTIVTVHDLFAVQAARGLIRGHPPVRVAGRTYQALVRRGLARAHLLIADSEATREDVGRLLGRASAVAHIPLDPYLAAPFAVGSPARRPYFLIVGPPGWRKRRDRGVEVWLRLRRTSRYEGATLLVVGPGLTPDEQKLAGVALDYVEVRDAVTDEVLRSLYAGCVAVLVMSSHEGFGWPVVEANAQGRPAVCSDLPVLREVGGEAASFIAEDLDQMDWESVANALANRHSLAARGNAARFTREKHRAGLGRAIAGLDL